MPEPGERNDQECAILTELICSVSYLRNQSKDLQRALAKQLRFAQISKGQTLTRWQNGMFSRMGSEWLVIIIRGTLGVYAQKSKRQKSFLSEDLTSPPSSMSERKEEDDYSESSFRSGDSAGRGGERICLTKRNIAHLIKPGQAFPHASRIPFEKEWWGYSYFVQEKACAEDKEMRRRQSYPAFSNRSDNNRKAKANKVSEITCDYCITALSENVEFLYMPNSSFNSIVFPSQDLSYSTERTRNILKIDPARRNHSDTAYLVNNVLKPYTFFQQMTVTARQNLAKTLTLWHVQEGDFLVDFDEISRASYIFLTGSADVRCKASSDAAERSADNGSSKVLAKVVPGDIFGVETMIQNKPSDVRLQICETSEVILLREANYRRVIGCGDLYLEQRIVRTFNFDTICSFPSFEVIRKAPPAVLAKLRQGYRCRLIPAKSALGKSTDIFMVILKGSVSLHRSKKKKARHAAMTLNHIRDQQASSFYQQQPTAFLDKKRIKSDLENCASREWWKSMQVEGAERILEGGCVLGNCGVVTTGRRCSSSNSSRGYFCFTRTATIVVEFLGEGSATATTANGRLSTDCLAAPPPPQNKIIRRLACEKVHTELERLGQDDISRLNRIEVIKLFEANPVLSRFSPSLMNRMACNCCSVQRAKAGELIDFELEDDNHLCVILCGSAECWVENSASMIPAGSAPTQGEGTAEMKSKQEDLETFYNAEDVTMARLGFLNVGDWFGDSAWDADKTTTLTSTMTTTARSNKMYNVRARSDINIMRVSINKVLEAVERKCDFERMMNEMLQFEGRRRQSLLKNGDGGREEGKEKREEEKEKEEEEDYEEEDAEEQVFITSLKKSTKNASQQRDIVSDAPENDLSFSGEGLGDVLGMTSPMMKRGEDHGRSMQKLSDKSGQEEEERPVDLISSLKNSAIKGANGLNSSYCRPGRTLRVLLGQASSFYNEKNILPGTTVLDSFLSNSSSSHASSSSVRGSAASVGTKCSNSACTAVVGSLSFGNLGESFQSPRRSSKNASFSQSIIGPPVMMVDGSNSAAGVSENGNFESRPSVMKPFASPGRMLLPAAVRRSITKRKDVESRMRQSFTSA